MVKESAYIAIDMGAGSIRIMLGKLSDILSVQEVFRFDNNPVEIDGHLRWNLKEIENGILIGVKKAIELSDIPVQSISVDSWGVDFVILGENGKPLEFPVSYRDSRTEGMQALWEKFMSKKKTFSKTGINYYPFNSLFQFLSIKDSFLLKSAKTILFIADYINYFLSGIAVNELSLASTTQLLNAKEQNWDKEILQSLNIPNHFFSSPRKAGFILGKLKKKFGDAKINVVLAPGHDSASALVAVPAISENFAFISTGTWCVMGTESDIPFTSDLALENSITNEMKTDGGFRPLKNIMGLWLIQQLRKSLNPCLSYSEIEEMCSGIKSSDYIVDTDNPLFYNPSDMVDAFDKVIYLKYKVKLKTPAAYYRCAYESLAYSFFRNLKILEKLQGKPFNTIHITGGGCQSEILCQLTSNATGLPVHAGPVEGASLGNILYQGITDGKIENLTEARSVIRKSFKIKTYYPQK